MRKTTLGVVTSLDLYTARSDGSMDWLYWSKDMASITNEFWSTIDAVVLDSQTYEVARHNGTPSYPGVTNYVLASSVSAPARNDVEIVTGDPVEFVRDLKASEGRGICILSGGKLARTLLEAGLVDEIGINLHPILLGSGVPLFAGLDQSIGLELIAARTLPGGCVLVSYRVQSGAIGTRADH